MRKHYCPVLIPFSIAFNSSEKPQNHLAILSTIISAFSETLLVLIIIHSKFDD